jgi:hypothetical protein
MLFFSLSVLIDKGKWRLTPLVLATKSPDPGNRPCILRADARGVTGSRSVLTSRIGALVDGTLGIPVWRYTCQLNRNDNSSSSSGGGGWNIYLGR